MPFVQQETLQRKVPRNMQGPSFRSHLLYRSCQPAKMIYNKLQIYAVAICSMAMLGAAAALFLAGNSEQGSAGLIWCPSPKWDFGQIDPSVTSHLAHEYVLHNRGDVSLSIVNIQADCSCVVPGDHATAIPAGGKVSLPVEFKVYPEPGPVQRYVRVEIADASSPLMLSLQGEILPTASFFAEPSAFDFGVFIGSEEKTRIVTLRRYDGTPVSIREIMPPFEGCRLVVRESITDNGGVDIQLTINSEEIIGAASSGCSVAIVTTHSTHRAHQIPVVFRVAL